ncbi:MAG: hypothetical protein IJ776_10195 [Paludibacteraceae bacterium]|nr:hypothetical protein [Paludibacteraceae bacterium]
MRLICLILLFVFHTAERDSAERCMQITAEQDRQYVCPESDSVIQYAVDYYDRHGNRSERARAHYLLGCVEADLFNRAQAIYELRLASRLNPNKESNQQALIYSRLGYLLYEHRLYDEAWEIYDNARELAIVRKDTTDLIHSLMQLGCLLMTKGDYEAAAPLTDEAWQLAETQDDAYLRATVLTAVYRLRRQTGDSEGAERAARLCMATVPHPMRTWPAMYNLGETLYYKEQYDSAKMFLEPIMEIDHSYQLRADAADLLEKIAFRQGDRGKAHTYSELKKALERSAQMSLETTNVLRRELYELERQAEMRRRTELVLWICLALLLILLVVVGYVIVRRYRQKTALRQQIRTMQTERQALIAEEFESSEVNQKLQRLIEVARENPFAKENLTASDWQQLMVYTDNMYSGIMTHLRSEYGLTEDELHICLMFLMNVPVVCMGFFVKGYSRNTIQLKARQIPINAGAKKGTLLRDWLAGEVQHLQK